MIGYLKGKVKLLTAEYVLLEVNGVGYEVVCSGAAFSALSGVAEGEVYTYLQVKEDGVTLFGFADMQEKDLFLKLTSVSSVGAKTAIAILSCMRPDEVYEAIATADTKRLAKAKGLGKKTAERIILELHGKISADQLLGGSGQTSAPTAEVLSNDEEDVISALVGLGFTKQESVRGVQRAKATGAVTVEDLLSAALRSM